MPRPQPKWWNLAISLRKRGFTYREIQKSLEHAGYPDVNTGSIWNACNPRHTRNMPDWRKRQRKV